MHTPSTPNLPYHIIVSVSGGLGSAETLRRCVKTYGKDRVVAVFADVKGDGRTHSEFSNHPQFILDMLHERFGGETRDTYRFIWQLAHHFDIPIHVVKYDDNSIWTTFAQKKFFRLHSGGGFICPASQLNKRQAIVEWIRGNFKAGTYVMALGMAWDEGHRVKSAQGYWSKQMGWEVPVIAPNAEYPYADNISTANWCHENDIEIPSAYSLGFSHNNCGGGCVNAGLGHFALLYKDRPDTYWYWAFMEGEAQKAMSRPYTILKRTRDGITSPITLYEYAEYIEAGDYPKVDIGGCNCFMPANKTMADFMAQAEVRGYET